MKQIYRTIDLSNGLALILVIGYCETIIFSIEPVDDEKFPLKEFRMLCE